MSNPHQVWRTYIDAWNRHDIDAILHSSQTTSSTMNAQRRWTVRCRDGQPSVHISSARSPRFRISAST
jgi:hypothetical protein